MNKRKLQQRKRKRRLRRFKPELIPKEPMVSITDSTAILSEAYPISIYWDNDLNLFIAELDDFGVQIHAPSWALAASAAKIAHILLIENYRTFGYTLPEVG